MSKHIDTLLLTALPASGKSEVRKFLEELETVGQTVQLDDYPYVHMMRRISEELQARGEAGMFFQSSQEPFRDARDWGTLIELINEDYRDVHEKPKLEVEKAAAWLFDRLDGARRSQGIADTLSQLPDALQRELQQILEDECREVLEDKRAAIPDSLEGRTIVIEFARGGPQGAPMPLEAPYGYAHSFSCLSDEILRRASILYIWVTPEESRRKNIERAKPGRDGDASILHHGVPEAVMLGDYGTDDMAYLIEQSPRPDTVCIEKHGKTYFLPVARFDNRKDLTTFVRKDRSQWSEAEIDAIQTELLGAISKLSRTASSNEQ